MKTRTKRSLVPRRAPASRGESFQSRVSDGLRRKSPDLSSWNPARSTSARTVDSSIRWSVFTSLVPAPAFALWSTIAYTPPGFSFSNTERFIRSRSTSIQTRSW